MGNRPAIPEEIKRAVRQKCKFGCVICRSPLYDYEHYEEYSNVKSHDIDNIFLVCPSCHRAKGVLYNKNKIKESLDVIQNEPAYGHYICMQHPAIDLGSNRIYGLQLSCVRFKIFDQATLSFSNKDSICFINAEFNDDNQVNLLRIVDNEIVICGNAWDVEFKGGWLTIRNKPREIMWKVGFDASTNIISIRGQILIDKTRKLSIRNNGIFCGKALIAKSCSFFGQSQFGIDFSNSNTVPSSNVFSSNICFSNFSGLDRCGVAGMKGGLLLEYWYLKKIHDSGSPHLITCASFFGGFNY